MYSATVAAYSTSRPGFQVTQHYPTPFFSKCCETLKGGGEVVGGHDGGTIHGCARTKYELQPFARQMEHLKLAKTTDCRSTDVFLTIFGSQLTGVPPTAFHDNLFF